MSEYIECVITQKKIKEICEQYRIAYGKEYGGFAKAIAEVTENQPTSVEIVKCRDCKFYDGILFCKLRNKGVIVTRSDFCSFGIRRG